MVQLTDRVLGCLQGIAVGDAVGKQTENLSHDDVRRWYPGGLAGFAGPPGTPIPRYRHHKRRQWLIGETTDDTERTLAVTGSARRAILAAANVGGDSDSVHPSPAE